MLKELIETADAFNRLYPVGTILIVVDDFGKEHKRKLLSPAWVIGYHSVVAKFEGLSGGYDIRRVKHVMTYKNSGLGFSYLVPADGNGVRVQ